MAVIPAFFDERQLLHQPAREMHNGAWTPYAETPDRGRAIAQRLVSINPTKDLGLDPILRVHDIQYIEFLRDAFGLWRGAGREGDALGYTWPVVRRRKLALDRIDARIGYHSYDAATPIAESTWEASYWSAQTALTAMAAIVGGDTRQSFALCRPPGHHAGRDYCGGYCYLNNAAIAAQHARHAGRRVAILDIDYHHGNGTQDIFYEDPDVLFVSIHADPATDYPFFWGHRDERGQGPGEGKTLNLSLARGTDISGYRKALDDALQAIRAHQTDLLVVSFGADTFEEDPISHFRLGTRDYPEISRRIASLNLPVLVVMEGGYAVDALGQNVEAFLAGFGNTADNFGREK